MGRERVLQPPASGNRACMGGRMLRDVNRHCDFHLPVAMCYR